jgi:tetratricopeptide (TPR) repeat protein
LPAIIGGVVVLGVIAAVVLSPGPDNSTGDVVTVVGDDASAAAFAQGQQYLSSARWSEAIESFGNVADTHPQYAQAQEQKSFAETELANQREYNEIQALAEASDFVAALQRLQALPRSSSYRSRASDDGLENRILNGLIEQRINESHEAQQAGDVDAARQMITDTLALKPDEPRLIARLDQLNNPGAVQEPIPEVVPEPVVQAEPVAVPPPSPERPPGEPAERPAAVAATPQSAAAQPAVAPADSNPRVNPVIVDDAPVAAAEPQGSPSEQSSDLVNRARRLSVDRNFAEAIRLLEEASALTPGNAQVYLMLFNNYQRIGNNLRAARSVRRYLELVPGDSRRAEFEEWLQANAP